MQQVGKKVRNKFVTSWQLPRARGSYRETILDNCPLRTPSGLSSPRIVHGKIETVDKSGLQWTNVSRDAGTRVL